MVVIIVVFLYREWLFEFFAEASLQEFLEEKKAAESLVKGHWFVGAGGPKQVFFCIICRPHLHC